MIWFYEVSTSFLIREKDIHLGPLYRLLLEGVVAKKNYLKLNTSEARSQIWLFIRQKRYPSWTTISTLTRRCCSQKHVKKVVVSVLIIANRHFHLRKSKKILENLRKSKSKMLENLRQFSENLSQNLKVLKS